MESPKGSWPTRTGTPTGSSCSEVSALEQILERQRGTQAPARALPPRRMPAHRVRKDPLCTGQLGSNTDQHLAPRLRLPPHRRRLHTRSRDPAPCPQRGLPPRSVPSRPADRLHSGTEPANGPPLRRRLRHGRLPHRPTHRMGRSAWHRRPMSMSAFPAYGEPSGVADSAAVLELLLRPGFEPHPHGRAARYPIGDTDAELRRRADVPGPGGPVGGERDVDLHDDDVRLRTVRR